MVVLTYSPSGSYLGSFSLVFVIVITSAMWSLFQLMDVLGLIHTSLFLDNV